MVRSPSTLVAVFALTMLCGVLVSFGVTHQTRGADAARKTNAGSATTKPSDLRRAIIPGAPLAHAVSLEVGRQQTKLEYTVPADRKFVLTKVLSRGAGSAKLYVSRANSNRTFHLTGNDEIDFGYPTGVIYQAGERLRLEVEERPRTQAWLLGYETVAE